mgnify:CR=1 FL=1
MLFPEKIEEIDFLAHQLMIIFGIIISILGIIGNLLNIRIFSIWSQSYRKTNLPLYLLASSFANLVVLLYPLLTRILFDGYQYRVTKTNVFILCQLRYYVLHTFDLISLSSICLAIFDRYLISSRNVYIRELITTKKQTLIVILSLGFLIGLHNIPLMIYFGVSKAGRCEILSIKYSYYYLYVFQMCLHGIFPILFLSIFGILTLKQLKILEEHNRSIHLNSDRQLSRMLLLMSIAIILSSIPNCIEETYAFIFVDKNQERSSKFFLYHVISSILFYTNPVTSFYIFYISTPNFRLQLRNLFCHDQRTNELCSQSDVPSRKISNV